MAGWRLFSPIVAAVLNGSARGVSITCRRASLCVYFSTKNQHKTTKTKISGDPCSRNSWQSKRPSLKLLTEFDGLNWLLKRMSTVFNGLVKGVPVMASAPFCVFIIACSIKASQRCQFQILDNNRTVTKTFDEVLVTVFLGSAVWGQRPSLYLHYSMPDLIVAIRLNLRRWDF